MARPEWQDEREILDLVHESIFARDRDLKITFWNAAAEELYGWTRDEALGRDADALLQCQHPLPLAEREAELFATGRWHGEFTRRTKSGSSVLVEVTWTVRRDEAGEPVEVVETGRNITEKRQVEEASRLSEYRFRNLFEAMAVAFWEIDFTEVGTMLKGLRDRGVSDLRCYMMEHGGFVREAMDRSIVRDVNAKGLQLFGAGAKDEVIGTGIGRFWPAESMAVYVEALVATMEKRPHYITETRMLTLQGQPIDVLFTVAWSSESRQSGIILVGMVDISDRVRAFEALERSEVKWRSLFNYMPIALWQLESRRMRDMFDALRRQGVEDFHEYIAEHPEFLDEAQASLTITEANEQAVKLFGAPDRETLLPVMSDLWLDRGDWADAAAARLSGARSHSAEAAIKTLDGRRVEVMFSVAFADPNNPESSNLVGAIDISESKRAREALARSELKYRNLFQHMPLSIWQIDTSELIPILARLRSEGVTDLNDYMDAHPDFLGRVMQILRVEQVNQGTVRMFGGRSPEDFVGPIARYWQDSPDTLRRSLVARYAGAESYAEETRVRTLDGRAIDVFFTSAFPAALSEMGIGLVGAIDIGDRLQAERMLRQVQADFAHAARVAMLGELTASIAHEVNQPLAAIATNGEASLRWLARPEPDVKEVRALAGRMVADARRAADVIARIRGMAARQTPAQAPVSVNEVVEDSLNFLRHELQAHRMEVYVDLARDLPDVLADRTQLQQVVVNLAVNAMQAVEERHISRPRLTVRSALSDGRVRVEVEDNGPGIAPDHAAQLFDSFFTTKQNGLGIGLSICRSIIEAHGGEISCATLPSGTRFAFSLPAAEPEPQLQPHPAPAHTKV